jgi:transketolase
MARAGVSVVNVKSLEKRALWVRRKVLSMVLKAHAGHLAPAFSCVEILVALYYGRILRCKPELPQWKARDRFILSKGQAAAALYACLAGLGFFQEKELMTYTREGSMLGGHTENAVPGVEACTGSLGHGLSISAGMAFGAQLDGRRHLCVSLLGDGECHEGSVWEAAMFAGCHRLKNLVAIIDNNGLSATDYLKNYLALDPLAKKWEAFGWDVVQVQGHDFESLINVMGGMRDRRSDKPLAIIAHTIKGKGISFIENKPLWHYRIPVNSEVARAWKELKD